MCNSSISFFKMSMWQLRVSSNEFKCKMVQLNNFWLRNKQIIVALFRCCSFFSVFLFLMFPELYSFDILYFDKNVSSWIILMITNSIIVTKSLRRWLDYPVTIEGDVTVACTFNVRHVSYVSEKLGKKILWPPLTICFLSTFRLCSCPQLASWITES